MGDDKPKRKFGGPQPGSGRPKGIPNPKTKAWNELGEYITRGASERYMKILANLSDEEFTTRYERILEYFKPKMARTEVVGKDGESLFMDQDQAKAIMKIYADALALRTSGGGNSAGSK